MLITFLKDLYQLFTYASQGELLSLTARGIYWKTSRQCFIGLSPSTLQDQEVCEIVAMVINHIALEMRWQEENSY